MSLEQAMSIIENVCSKALGNLADHNAIQQALSVIRESTKPKVVQPEKPQE